LLMCPPAPQYRVPPAEIQIVPTSRVRVLVGVFVVVAALVTAAPIAAQARVGSLLQNGQIAVKIYVTMNQTGMPSGRPISGYAFLIVAPSGERSTVTTSEAGAAELRLSPGAYHVLSFKPLEWYGHHYMWDLPLEVREGMHVLDLTPTNSAQEDGADERVAVAPTTVASAAPRPAPYAAAPTVQRERTDESASAPPAYLYKSPGEAALFSFLIPGVGQMYNGQVGKGIGLFLVSTAGVAVLLGAEGSCNFSSNCGDNTAPAVIGGSVFLGAWIYSIFDAYSGAKNHNAKLGFRVGAVPVNPYLGVARNGATTVGLSLAVR
jgi:hypothetical protein